MLGEKIILGTKEVSMDEKGRMIIPSFAYPTPDEEVVFTVEDKESFYISSLEMLKNTLINLKNERYSTINSQKIFEIERRIEQIYKTAIDIAQIDKNARIIVPKFIRSEIIFVNDETQKSTNLIAQGNGYRLKYYINKNAYYNSLVK